MIHFYVVPERRCPCDCDGNGALVYLACPSCGRVVLVCDEIGNVFDNLESFLDSSPLVIWRSAGQLCPGCKGWPLSEFIAADQQRILGAGVNANDFAVAPLGMPFSIPNLAKG